ncbi:MAG: Isoleucyl-tRNA synthetase, partial [Berkelbacteria bacterium GW2011_GWA2_38_9]
PLAEIKVNQGLSEELAKLIRDEANVKQVNFVPSSDWTNLANSSNWTKASDNSLEIALNTELTPELEEEGLVRELIRQINQLRKNQNLTIQDQVEIFYSTDDKKLSGIIEKNSAEITKNTVSSKISKFEQTLNYEIVKINSISISLKLFHKNT